MTLMRKLLSDLLVLLKLSAINLASDFIDCKRAPIFSHEHDGQDELSDLLNVIWFSKIETADPSIVSLHPREHNPKIWRVLNYGLAWCAERSVLDAFDQKRPDRTSPFCRHDIAECGACVLAKHMS